MNKEKNILWLTKFQMHAWHAEHVLTSARLEQFMRASSIRSTPRFASSAELARVCAPAVLSVFKMCIFFTKMAKNEGRKPFSLIFLLKM